MKINVSNDHDERLQNTWIGRIQAFLVPHTTRTVKIQSSLDVRKKVSYKEFLAVANFFLRNSYKWLILDVRYFFGHFEF